MDTHDQNYRRGVERKLNNRGRKIIDWWDGEPIHQAMTPYERYAFQQKQSGNKVIDEETFNLGFTLMNNKNGLDAIFNHKV